MQTAKAKEPLSCERLPQKCMTYGSYKKHHSTKSHARTAIALTLSILAIGIPGGMERNSIEMVPGFLATLACLGGLYLLGRPYMIRSNHA